jgi:hypothetical protein
MPFNLDNFVQGANKLGGSIGGRAGQAIQAGAGLVGNISRLASGPISKLLPKGGQPTSGTQNADARFAGTDPKDWRVSLSVPTDYWENAKILQPLAKTGKFIFPFTPQITLSHQASYSAMDPIHNNYSFASYENSKLDKISISGDFYCENSDDASFWIASVHFLRSVTKMYFGENTVNAGAPPPVLKLNGYGDFVFNNVPVVVTNFTVDLPKDVDYIPSKFVGNQSIENADFDMNGVGYVPVKSTINVTVMPMYSREAVRNFNLQDFVKGNYIFDKGFI